jgi:PKD repeat protein
VIALHINDEHSQWVATVTNNGVATDYSTGYTFTCTVVNSAGATLLTKTTGITGAASGAITVAFTGAELSSNGVTATFGAPVEYLLFLVPRKTSDSSDGPTIEEKLQMRWRP